MRRSRRMTTPDPVALRRRSPSRRTTRGRRSLAASISLVEGGAGGVAGVAVRCSATALGTRGASADGCCAAFSSTSDPRRPSACTEASRSPGLVMSNGLCGAMDGRLRSALSVRDVTLTRGAVRVAALATPLRLGRGAAATVMGAPSSIRADRLANLARGRGGDRFEQASHQLVDEALHVPGRASPTRLCSAPLAIDSPFRAGAARRVACIEGLERTAATRAQCACHRRKVHLRVAVAQAARSHFLGIG